MTVAELIAQLQKFPADSEIYISNQQGLYEQANPPHMTQSDRESISGEIMPAGSVVMSYENT